MRERIEFIGLGRTGRKLKVPMPTVSLVRQFLGMLQATHRGELDFSALLLLMEKLAGIRH